MDDNKKQPPVSLSFAIIALLLAILLAVLVWFGSDILSLYKQGLIAPKAAHTGTGNLNRPPLGPDEIQGWMTFRYVNYVFRLPNNYLATKLNIGSADYQNITLNKYAKRHGLNYATFAQSVRSAVTSYQGGDGP